MTSDELKIHVCARCGRKELGTIYRMPPGWGAALCETCRLKKNDHARGKIVRGGVR